MVVAFLAVVDLVEALAADLAVFALAGAFLAAAVLGFTEDARLARRLLGLLDHGGL